MKKRISYPRLGDYDVVFSYFLKNITNNSVVPSPKITKKTIELGEKHSPNDACLPFKYTLGNLIETLDNGCNILIQGGGGCRYRYYAETQETILRDLGYNFKLIKLVENGEYNLRKTYKKFKEINKDLTYIKFLYHGIIAILMIIYMDKIDSYIRKNIGFEVQKNSFNSLKKEMLNRFINIKGIFHLKRVYKFYKKEIKKVEINKKNPIKIGIIGELYTAMEKMLLMI